MPTVAIPSNASVKAICAAADRLRPAATRNAEADARFVIKPAVGGGGDGVECLNDDATLEAPVVGLYVPAGHC